MWYEIEYTISRSRPACTQVHSAEEHMKEYYSQLAEDDKVVVSIPLGFTKNRRLLENITIFQVQYH